MKTKNFKRTFKALAITLLFSAPIASFAQASDSDLSGSYRGIVQDSHKSKVDLILRSLKNENRDGSYLAILVQENPDRVSIYQVDPRDSDINPGQSNQFEMIPRQVSPDGAVIGVNNPDPTLLLNIDNTSSPGHPQFTIVDAHSSNNSEFQGSVIFDGEKSSNLVWNDLSAGEYRLKGYSATLTEMNGVSGENQEEINLSLPAPLSGDFILRRQLQGVYTLEAISRTATGSQLERFPRKILVFVRHRNHDCLLLINPGSYSDVIELRK